MNILFWVIVIAVLTVFWVCCTMFFRMIGRGAQRIYKVTKDELMKEDEEEAEAKANQTIANSITDSLLAKMEMEARLKHGWITVQGAPTVVKED